VEEHHPNDLLLLANLPTPTCNATNWSTRH